MPLREPSTIQKRGLADFTAVTIRQLIEEWERDAWISLIHDDIEMCTP
jgi:hypothetical protein